jgi:quinol-cytochrome oxidoreductase complex cytochrome b subunit
MGRIFDWLDGRFALRRPHRRFFQRYVPENLSYTYCFGGMAFAFFLFLAVTGLLLSLHYVPSEREAYRSIVTITEEVTMGRLIRGLHKWSATFFIVCIMMHSIRVFVSRAYRPPRELNWMVGVITFVVAMASGFTGYLLPWDQKAFWATEVGTSMVRTIPFIGEEIMYAVRGGAEVRGPTLIRFYSLHVIHLPFMISLLLIAHFHMVKRQGIARQL